MKRRADIEHLQKEKFDLVIIGGGITGAGIFLEAAQRGYHCLLLEKGDFASGTSSKSAKLIHGGIRYLKYGKIGLIKESLEERNYLLKTFPHLVKPMPFLFPVYDSTFKYRVGMAVYHFLSKGETLPDYQYLEKEEVITHFPAINPEGLRGGFIYFDAVTNDARLCTEVIHEGTEFMHNYALNYCEVISSEKKGGGVLIKTHDHLENKELIFETDYIVNAGGVWADDILKRTTQKETHFSAPSKGVHLILSKKRFPYENAMVIPSYANDNRMNYSVPWENDSVIIGTTDTDYSGTFDQVTAEEKDIDYLIHSIRNFAPSLNITRKDVIYTYSGLRPMYNDSAPSYERSRDYRIWWENDTVLSILGGKLTSYHSMAESLLNELWKKASTVGKGGKTDVNKFVDSTTLPKPFTDKIREHYLEKAFQVFAIAHEHKNNVALLHPDFNVTIAEVIYYIRYMHCYHLSDLLGRRLSLTYVLNGCSDKVTVIKTAAELMQRACGWTQEELEKEIESYHALLDQTEPKH